MTRRSADERTDQTRAQVSVLYFIYQQTASSKNIGIMISMMGVRVIICVVAVQHSMRTVMAMNLPSEMQNQTQVKGQVVQSR